MLLLSISPRKYEGHCFLLFRETESLMNKSLGYNQHEKSLQVVQEVVHPCVILSVCVCICLCMYVCPFVSLCLCVCVCVNHVLDEGYNVEEKKLQPNTQPLHDEREWPIGTSSNITLVGLAGRGMT